MKKTYLLKQSFALSIALLIFTHCIQAQTNIFPSTGSAGIGTTTPNASSLLEMVSTSKGLLIPRMTKTQRDNIAITPPTGLLIFQTNSAPGFYYYDGSAWTAVTPKAKGWALNGNLGTNPATNFIGTADAQPLVFKVNNTRAGYLDNINANTSFGYQALISNTGIDNTATGGFTLALNTTGYYNTATGALALYNNNDGIGNTANGTSALRGNTNGSNNTAMGLDALFANTTGYSNVAIGAYSLFNNTTGSNLIAIGDSALYNQNGGYGYNTAIGSKALYSNTTGGVNTATGYQALYSNNFGEYNTASGTNALYSNTSGFANTAFGNNSLYYNLAGSSNTGFGYQALYFNVSGNYNTAIGDYADVNSDYYTVSSAFGASSLITASHQVRIGDGSVLSIGGYKAWTNLSDGRVKKNIKENVPGLAFINLLKPITYNLDLDEADKIVQRPANKDKNGKPVQPSQEEINARRIQQQVVCTGFIAQDVEAIAKKIGYDFDGVDAAKNDKDLYGLRYSEFVVPLVKAVQELSKLNNDKDAKINNLETRLAKLEAMMNVQQSVMSNQSSVSQQRETINQEQETAKLEQNIPNPFSNTTTISYSLPQFRNGGTSARIIITDKAGKVLKQVNISGNGKGSVQLNASTLSAGAYQYSLVVDGKLIETKQMERLE